MRASGPTTTTTMLGRKESNLQPSASEAAALPVAPLPNALLPMSGWRGSNPRVSGWKPDAFPPGDTRMWDRRELNPQPRAEEALALPVELQTRDGRGEDRTHHARERAAGLRPAGPPLVTSRPCSRARPAEPATFTTDIRAVRERRNKSGRRESNPLLREGVPVPNQWATPACARQEGVEPSAAGFGGPCPYRWGFCRRWLRSAVD
jgi:hypothetical protein